MLGAGFQVRDLSSEPDMPEVEESGSTFGENAILKAVAASQRVAGLVVADDSGLEVDVLGGAPGVYSARYAGRDARDDDNVKRLLLELRRHGAGTLASARFRCVLALAEKGKVIGTYDGVVEGAIVPEPRGAGGFGYDPVFQPAGFAQTFAELSAEEKNRISHRANAIRHLRRALFKPL